MSSGRKCKNCGGSDIEVDQSRGDAVCTNCGVVLENSIIVSEVQFEENKLGTSSAIGQFVSADSKGGATKFGASFHMGSGLESREQTLRKARNGIAMLCNQLRLNEHYIDTACNLFGKALSMNFTRGRRNTHVHGACVYLTCRTEGTEHLLIDVSDVLQVCCYELGRTYLKLAHALCINVPSIDPCLYVFRFAARLQFGEKTQMVTNTALRLVQRMKRDSIHSGRRPSGLCGAALLMAARLHEFNRSLEDIIKVVKVHGSTLRKRLWEFGATPSSSLTLEEFMTIDLEEEQDPPSFKAARKKDKERLQKLMEEEAENLTDLQKQIELQLEKDIAKKKWPRSRMGFCKEDFETADTRKFVEESTRGTIERIMAEEQVDGITDVPPVQGLGPDIESMGLANSLDDTSNAFESNPPLEMVLTLDDLDESELDTYILNEDEAKCKKELWYERNATYLEEQKAKAEKAQKEREEGKPDRKRKRTTRKKRIGPASSASEAIEKILIEKKISSKINYDVLKSLISAPDQNDSTTGAVEGVDEPTTSESINREQLSEPSNQLEQVPTKNSRKKAKQMSGEIGLPVADVPIQTNHTTNNMEVHENMETKEPKKVDVSTILEEENEEDYYDEEPPVEESTNELGLFQMLRQHRADDEDGNNAYDYDYEDY